MRVWTALVLVRCKDCKGTGYGKGRDKHGNRYMCRTCESTGKVLVARASK